MIVFSKDSLSPIALVLMRYKVGTRGVCRRQRQLKFAEKTSSHRHIETSGHNQHHLVLCNLNHKSRIKQGMVWKNAFLWHHQPKLNPWLEGTEQELIERRKTFVLEKAVKLLYLTCCAHLQHIVAPCPFVHKMHALGEMSTGGKKAPHNCVFLWVTKCLSPFLEEGHLEKCCFLSVQ